MIGRNGEARRGRQAGERRADVVNLEPEVGVKAPDGGS
jgi:hypothetical protein